MIYIDSKDLSIQSCMFHVLMQIINIRHYSIASDDMKQGGINEGLDLAQIENKNTTSDIVLQKMHMDKSLPPCKKLISLNLILRF